MGCIRLYIEPREDSPPQRRINSFVPIIDCNPEQVRDLKRRLQRQGYTVTCVPL